jgi:hypothetical protein
MRLCCVAWVYYVSRVDAVRKEVAVVRVVDLTWPSASSRQIPYTAVSCFDGVLILWGFALLYFADATFEARMPRMRGTCSGDCCVIT